MLLDTVILICLFFPIHYLFGILILILFYYIFCLLRAHLFDLFEFLLNFHLSLQFLFFLFRQDNIIGVSECIIMGVPIPIGTGIFKLVHKVKGQTVKCEKRERLLDTI